MLISLERSFDYNFPFRQRQQHVVSTAFSNNDNNVIWTQKRVRKRLARHCTAAAMCRQAHGKTRTICCKKKNEDDTKRLSESKCSHLSVSVYTYAEYGIRQHDDVDDVDDDDDQQAIVISLLLSISGEGMSYRRRNVGIYLFILSTAMHWQCQHIQSSLHEHSRVHLNWQSTNHSMRNNICHVILFHNTCGLSVWRSVE